MKLAVVKIVENYPKSGILKVKEIHPSPNDGVVDAYLLNPLPMSENGAGLFAAPKVQEGIYAVALLYNYRYLILGFFTDFTPALGYFHTVMQEEHLSAGDINMRGDKGTRVTIGDNGMLTFFANIWARLHFSQKLSKITGFFKNIEINWLGGQISQKESKFRAFLGQDYEKQGESDANESLEEDIVGENAYVDKVLAHNETSPLTIETRQRLSTTSPKYAKDAFTVEHRGSQHGDPVLQELHTKDKMLQVETRQAVDQLGLVQKAQSPDWTAETRIGSGVDFQLDTGEIHSKISLTHPHGENNDRLVISSNNEIIAIGDNFKIARQGTDVASAAFNFVIDDAGNLVFDTNAFTLTSEHQGDVELSVKEGELHLGGDASSVNIQPTGADNVLTPNTVFGVGTTPWVDTFTGLPFIGSQAVGVSAQKDSTNPNALALQTAQNLSTGVGPVTDETATGAASAIFKGQAVRIESPVEELPEMSMTYIEFNAGGIKANFLDGTTFNCEGWMHTRIYDITDDDWVTDENGVAMALPGTSVVPATLGYTSGMVIGHEYYCEVKFVSNDAGYSDKDWYLVTNIGVDGIWTQRAKTSPIDVAEPIF